MYSPIPNHTFLCSTYIPPDNNGERSDAVIVTAIHPVTGETKLHIIPDPQTQVFITREALRNHTFKKEYERIDNLDTYICGYKDQFQYMADALNNRRVPPYMAYKTVTASPFCYAWDININTKVKLEYIKSEDTAPRVLAKGMLDIETSVLGDEQIICGSVAVWNRREVYCFILASWLNMPEEVALKELEQRTIKEHATFAGGLNPVALSLWNNKPPTVKYHICKNERELIQKMISCVKFFKLNAIGVWNMGYDIPYIIGRANFRQLDLGELFCHKDIPAKYRYFKWVEDRSNPAHFSETWHTVDCPGYGFYYDAMCLYSRLRKVQGKENSYTLDYIGNKIIGAGKMRFGANATHAEMQTNDRIGYCVYNTLDTIIPALMDDITKDLASLLTLLGPATLADFSKQTVQLAAQFYVHLLAKGMVPGAVRGSIATPNDKYIGNIGGAVLNPVLLREQGLRCLNETTTPSSIYKLACDLDFSSFYPSIIRAFNVSRETKYSTVYHMDGCPHTLLEIDAEPDATKQQLMAVANAEYLYRFFGRYPCVEANAVPLCTEHFNLPSYAEMLAICKG